MIVTSSFSETKGFFCCSFNKRSPEDQGCHWKNVFFCIRNISKRKQISGKTHAKHCLTHLNKTACEIWSVFDKVQLWVKNLAPFSTEAFIYYISIVRLTGLGTISIHEEQFQISEAGRKQSESIWNCFWVISTL